MNEPSMDFAFDEQQQILRDLASAVFAEHGADERIAQTERDGTAYDHELWAQLIDTGLLDAILPVTADGGGLGMVGLAIILEQQGRYLCRVPLAPTAVAAMALAHFGDEGTEILPSIRDGRARVAVAGVDPLTRVTVGQRGDQWVLNGALPQVYLAGSCTHLLVIADDSGRDRALLLPVERCGIDIDPFEGISRNIQAAITFTDCVAEASECLGGPANAGEPARWVRDRLLTGLAAIESGLCREAVRRTARYSSERQQFGRPLSTNQGVAMRAADAHIDTEAIRLTMLDAAWQLDQGENATEAVLIAAWWAREGGVRVVHATQHLHGGMGADTDSHIHRFFLWARELDIVAGPAPALLHELGDILSVAGTPRGRHSAVEAHR
ncbi:acyl-CoA/acyl-ACP dehydrogenase [Nocardia speluncae]|uniref:Acyl-CoA/acyl-ACP dehydrogenase n=1 Tax=Nocardia speluncae TaxID=419477 RepID=A0A846XBH6_9NOCA|nr:acyl-CoA dehydrogenase family protein [Nocardia speluncae]NKY33292.1 acyl-CoA/acyl-ACP dehydrogenase [Nocardia speluncae]